MVARINNVSSKAFSQILVPPKVQAVAPARPPAAVIAAPSPFTVSLGQTRLPAGLYTSSGISDAMKATPAMSGKPATAGIQANAARAADASSSIAFIAGSGQVVVDIMSSDSGYDNKIFWSSDNFATRHYLGIDNHTGTFNIGSFAPGTRIDFGIDNGQNQFFRTSAANTNADNFQHAKMTTTAAGTQIGFEDLMGGGERDFNDAIINVRSVPVPGATATAVSAPPATAKPVTPATDNRSGLGDGTNPGQGAGKTNSPNQGTSNPGGTSASAKKTG